MHANSATSGPTVSFSPNDFLIDQDMLSWFFRFLEGHFHRGKWFNDFVLPEVLDVLSILEAVVLADSVLTIDDKGYMSGLLEKHDLFREHKNALPIRFIDRRSIRDLCHSSVLESFKRDHEELSGHPVALEAAKTMAMDYLRYVRLSDDERADFDSAPDNFFIRGEEALGHPGYFEGAARVSRHIHLSGYKRLGSLPDKRWLRMLYDQALANATIAATIKVNYCPSSLNAPAMSRVLSSHISPAKTLSDTLPKETTSDIQALVALGLPATISIPPIPAIILSRSSSVGNLMKQTLEMRETFTEFRHTYRTLATTIRNPADLELRELLEQRREYLAEVDNAIRRLRDEPSDGRLLYELYDGICQA